MPSQNNSSEILVSICCTAYNVEKYINQAIDSFLMQETTFRYEIIIGEDLSSDNTRNIVREYCVKYPDLIQMVISSENVGVVRNYNRVFEKSQGKYIAICDGDDYFTDPYKLQQQVEFLEANLDYVICCHYSYLVNENSDVTYAAENLRPLIYSFGDIAIGKKAETRNSTMMIRNDLLFKEFPKKDWILKCHSQDDFIKLFATFTTGKKIYVVPDLMGSYRKHSASISKKSVTIIGPRFRNDFDLLITHFQFSTRQKRKLLRKYFKRFFLFDVKNFRIYKIITTVRNLLIVSEMK